MICFSNAQENKLVISLRNMNPTILSSNNLKHYMLAFGGLDLYFITLKWKVQINIMYDFNWKFMNSWFIIGSNFMQKEFVLKFRRRTDIITPHYRCKLY